MEVNGSRNETLSSSDQQLLQNLKIFHQRIEMYLPPILVVFGVSGNAMSIVIMRSVYFRSCPCSMLLAVLAVVDTGVLLTGLLRAWAIATFGVDIRVLGTWSCRIHYFVTYLLQHMSSWIVVLLTIERIISVFQPFRAKQLCRQRRLGYSLIFIFACLVVINSHVLFTLVVVDESTHGNSTEPDDLDCVFSEGNTYGKYIWPWVDYAFLALLPFLILSIGNSIIVFKILRRRKDMHVVGSVVSGRRRKKVASMTLMLFAVTLTFFLTTSPIEVFLIGSDHWDTSTDLAMEKTITAYVVCNLVFYFNNSFNFLLYCVSGSRFRRALLDFYNRHLARTVRTSSTRQSRVNKSTTWDRRAMSSRGWSSRLSWY